MSLLPPFHLAFPVNDLCASREFYGDLLGCIEGRSSASWIDFNLYGHQIVAHLSPEDCVSTQQSDVDGESVPVRHFGIVLPLDEWTKLAERLSKTNVNFVIQPTIRFQGEVGEQHTFFIKDPAGNALEFKAMRHPEFLFKRDD